MAYQKEKSKTIKNRDWQLRQLEFAWIVSLLKQVPLGFSLKDFWRGVTITMDALDNRSSLLTIVEVSSLVILNVLSLTGNILVCISIYKNFRLRSTTNLYIMALALSDLISAVFVMPLVVGVLITSDWVFGRVICDLHAFFGGFVIYISPVTMGLTAFNRYMRICKSEQQYKKIFSPWKSRTWLFCIWIFIACYSAVPKLVGLQDFVFVPGYAMCAPVHLSEAGKMIHYAIVLCLFLLQPLATTIFSYIKVAKMIQQHKAVSSSTIQRSERNARITAREIKLSKSLFAVVFAFMICWIPFWLIVILRRFRLVASMPRNIELLCMFLLYFSNTINPFIYAGMNPLFKREFRKILCCERRRNAVDVSNGRNSKTEEGKEGSTRTAALILASGWDYAWLKGQSFHRGINSFYSAHSEHVLVVDTWKKKKTFSRCPVDSL